MDLTPEDKDISGKHYVARASFHVTVRPILGEMVGLQILVAIVLCLSSAPTTGSSPPVLANFLNYYYYVLVLLKTTFYSSEMYFGNVFRNVRCSFLVKRIC